MLDRNAVIAKVLNWFATPLKIVYTDVQLGRAYGSSAKLTIPTVTGYTFVCWISAASISWINNVYVNQSENSVWNGNTGASGTGTATVRVYGLYVKTP